MKRILIATQNEGKMDEFNAAFNPLGYSCISLNDVGFKEEIIENGLTFFDNAYIKAKYISDKYNLVTLADDSGLIVEALPNELGVKSKRFSKEATHEANNLLLLEKMKNIVDRTAYFISQLVLYYPGGKFYTYQGRVYGEIGFDLRGNFGFGYDPLFIVDVIYKRMAELTKTEKNQVSHRGNALNKLIEDIKNEVIVI
ncbi:MAG: RdgB/HAM1 family non-canonical purine NTP pyrophosphatase [Tenericutes bacterium]|nr:RdgB/HAM1 family non-canonical purine NTP pyrophosphatase [Mycoplasmatota bacterium]